MEENGLQSVPVYFFRLLGSPARRDEDLGARPDRQEAEKRWRKGRRETDTDLRQEKKIMREKKGKGYRKREELLVLISRFGSRGSEDAVLHAWPPNN